MHQKKYFLTAIFACFINLATQAQRTINLASYGIKPSAKADQSAKIQRALQKIFSKQQPNEQLTIAFEPGEYHFYAPKAASRTYYISNHDQPNPKRIAMPLEHLNNVTIDGQGAHFVFHGMITPIALVNSANCTLRNFTIDYADPRITQARVVQNLGDKGMMIKPEKWVKYRIENNKLITFGDEWTIEPVAAMAFEPETHHVVYQTSDVVFNSQGVEKQKDGSLYLPHFQNKRLPKGTVLTLRNYDRPSPALFIDESKNTSIENIDVHFADGMGLLAQRSEHITLNHFNVCLKEGSDRYFTTQADATHFSQCRGTIDSQNGLYEAMMDDAINVHGVYLKITKRIDSQTIAARFMHHQAYGFTWGNVGDSVQFVASKTMDEVETNCIASIKRTNEQGLDSLKDVVIGFTQPLPTWNEQQTDMGIENITWTPYVRFANSTVRNNRARGALFSSLRKTIVENNLFDHTSGTAILLCGDCNGWYESGPCKDVLIQNNTFKNALTNMFQFTNAVISIYPEIPNLKNQQGYYHGGSADAIKIIGNKFITFDKPLLYAKSVDGLLFKDNIVEKSTDYAPFHWNKNSFLLEHCNRIRIE